MLTKILTVELRKMKGFTLVELMIALAISSFLLLGVVATYSSIHGTVKASKELENSQEVLRYTAHVFSRSLKQTKSFATVSAPLANVLTVTLPVDAINCFGKPMTVSGDEVYTFTAPKLSCKVNDGTPTGEVTKDLLTGIDTMEFSGGGTNMISINVEPKKLDQNLKFTDGKIKIDIALSSKIIADKI